MTSTPISFRPKVTPEDQARANYYALFARLFFDAPDAALLKAIAGAPPLDSDTPTEGFAKSWSDLIAASSAMDPVAAKDEYEICFVGMGKAPLNLHGSHHITGFMMEQPLSDVRESLKNLSLGRLSGQTLVEDHLSALCEVMRVLAAGTDTRNPEPIDIQKEFFMQHIASWYRSGLQQILTSPLANYYKVVAKCGLEFLELEESALNIGA